MTDIQASFKEESLDTADDYYPASHAPALSKQAVRSTLVQLNSKKTHLRNIQVEITSLKQRLNDLDASTEKEIIHHQFQSQQNSRLTEQQRELLLQKEAVAKETDQLK